MFPDLLVSTFARSVHLSGAARTLRVTIVPGRGSAFIMIPALPALDCRLSGHERRRKPPLVYSASSPLPELVRLGLGE